ncbi:MAG: response regulator transcription factor [Alphaproteobacteria bacterium]|nr:response regulator transcription factor [Alphaproteobacteria bacterium]MDA8004841.1 response regulator transcription factor [Alphaproteobacteria bacterium]MDA8006548.1 response regulator transcription factor [Alphaproteobacteria bacterium]MDA8013965.1 response regulator transcription factor [Alphaproteobacteria bacterium]
MSAQPNNPAPSATGERTRVLLADDDKGLRDSLSLILEQEGYEIILAEDGEAALTQFFARHPALVVLDIKMPRRDGTEVLLEIRRHSSVPVIFLTSKDTEVDELFGLRAGADDYISKPFSIALLAERIRTLIRREGQRGEDTPRPPPAPRGAGVLAHLELNADRHFCSWKGQEIHLTVTEFLMLSHLVQNVGMVISRSDLRGAVYSDASDIDERTIDSHIRRLRAKLRGADPEFNQIDTLYGLGYRFRDTGAAPE